MSTAKPKWHQEHMVAFDIESTGVNVFEDRIVTASVVHAAPGKRPRTITWLVNPGIPISDEAAAVHGWTNDRLTRVLDGAPALRTLNGVTKAISHQAAISEMATQVASTFAREQPLIVFNAPYDLTLLDTEAVRHDVDPVASRKWGMTGVVDPFVLDKEHDPYRKSCYKAPGCDVDAGTHECGGCRGGKIKCGGCGATNRKLTSLCDHYKVVHTGAHDATGDALATIRLTQRLVAAWPEIARLKLSTLHQKQVGWRAAQQDGLRSFFDKVGKDHDGMCPEWPIHTACVPSLVGVS